MPIADQNKHYDWIVSPDSYLALALLGCNNYSGIFKNLGFRSVHPDHEFVYPIVFNLKQGIELYIKGLGIIDTHGEYEGMHDLKALIAANIRKSKATAAEKIWEKLEQDIWPTVKKYYYGTYIPSNQNEDHPDKQNEAERYPEAKSGNCYEVPAAFEWVTVELVDNIKKDIECIRSFLEQAKRDIENQQNGGN